MNIMFCGDRGVCQGIFLSALSICKNIIEPINFYILTASVEGHQSITQEFANEMELIKELNKAIEERINKNHPIVIYPEAHVWEYYTEIRPFPETSFKYPAKLNKPVIAMTVTYRKSKVFKRPVMEVYLDGPYYATEESVKERTKSLHDRVYDVMKKRSKNSNVEYIQYRKKEKLL